MVAHGLFWVTCDLCGEKSETYDDHMALVTRLATKPSWGTIREEPGAATVAGHLCPTCSDKIILPKDDQFSEEYQGE